MTTIIRVAGSKVADLKRAWQPIAGPAQQCRWVLTILMLLAVPAFASAPDPGVEGPYPVGYYDRDFDNFDGRIWYPSVFDGENSTPDNTEGPYPAIVCAPGAFTGYNEMEWITRHYASHGYVVLSFKFGWILDWDPETSADGVQGGIDTVIADNSNAASPLHNLVDTESIGTCGFSLGGAGALWHTGRDNRVDTVVGLAPGFPNQSNQDAVDDNTAAINVPAQVLVGELDCIATDGEINGAAHYYGLIGNNGGKHYAELRDANHSKFLDKGGKDINFSGGSCEDSSTSVAEQQLFARQYSTAWFGYFLKGLTGDYDTWLFGDIARSDAEVGGALSQLVFLSPTGETFDSDPGTPPVAIIDEPGPDPVPDPPGNYKLTFESIDAEDGAVGAYYGGWWRSVAPEYYLLMTGKSAGNFKHYRALLSFDTSAIPADATIKSAMLQVRVNTQGFSPWDDPSDNLLQIDIKQGCFGDCSVERADWSATPTAENVSQLGRFAGASWQWWANEEISVSPNFSESGLASINRSGRTQLRLTWNQLQSFPGSYVVFREGTDAKLVVTYDIE